MEERRTAPRSRTYLGGQVTFAAATVDCVVRNVSPHGAKLHFSGEAIVPDTLDLTVSRQPGSRRAHIVWRTLQEAGVSF